MDGCGVLTVKGRLWFLRERQAWCFAESEIIVSTLEGKIWNQLPDLVVYLIEPPERICGVNV
jgi:hypothetical protein